MISSVIGLFALGVAVGTFGTLVGIGGGIILVPIFLLFMHYTPQNAVGTSLFVVLLNAVSGTYAYIRQKKVYYDAAIRFSLATIPGAFAGSYLSMYFTSKTFYFTFGLLLVLLGILSFIRSRGSKNLDLRFDPENFHYNRWLGILLSFFVGFLSSILGIGGGVIHVPILIYLLSFPTHIATATSHFVLAVSSFFGVTSHLSLGNVLLVPALSIGLGAVVGAQIGAKLSFKVKSKSIQLLLAIAMALLGLRLTISSLF